jgi:CheY-like chemotaxis protein
MAKKIILLAEADEALRDLLREILEAERFELLESSSPQITLEILRTHRQLDCCIVDLGILDLQGDTYVEELFYAAGRAGFPLALTSFSPRVREIAERFGASAWLLKPYELDALVSMAYSLTGRDALLSGA